MGRVRANPVDGLWSTTSVVNYALKIGDHTTPPLGDISLMSPPLATSPLPFRLAGAHRHSFSSQERTFVPARKKSPISIQPQKCKSAKISFFGPRPATAPALSHGAALGRRLG
jgi:hypothetical protein